MRLELKFAAIKYSELASHNTNVCKIPRLFRRCYMLTCQHGNFTQGFFPALLAYFHWADLSQKLKKNVEGLSLKNLRGELLKKIFKYISYIFFFLIFYFFFSFLFYNDVMSHRNVISAGGGVSFISVAFINKQLLYNLTSKPNFCLPVRITKAILIWILDFKFSHINPASSSLCCPCIW